MNGKVAKFLRKKVYEESDFRDRNYGKSKEKGVIVNINKTDITKLSKRTIYQNLKKGIFHYK